MSPRGPSNKRISTRQCERTRTSCRSTYRCFPWGLVYLISSRMFQHRVVPIECERLNKLTRLARERCSSCRAGRWSACRSPVQATQDELTPLQACQVGFRPLQVARERLYTSCRADGAGRLSERGRGAGEEGYSGRDDTHDGVCNAEGVWCGAGWSVMRRRGTRDGFKHIDHFVRNSSNFELSSHDSRYQR